MNRPWAGLTVIMGVGIWLLVAGAEPASQPVTTAPANPTPLDPAAEKVLDRLQHKGDQIEDLEATVHYTKIDTVLESKQKYEGILLFKKDKPNPRFLIRFDKHVHDGLGSNYKEWHVFDGRWYIEAREKNKTIVKREILRPDEQRELFRLGRGPFPLPFGQQKSDIVRHFAVRLVPADPSDPANTDHLECTPLPGTDLARRYGTVHFYIDRSSDLPVRMRTLDKEEDAEMVVSFLEIKMNRRPASGLLDLPRLPDYEIKEERLEAQDAPSAEPNR